MVIMNMGEKDEIKIQSLSRFYILMLLKSEKLISGYYILKKLEKDIGTTASPTYVYDFLRKLEEANYIEHISTPKSKRAKGFKLTPLGLEFINRIFERFNNLIEAAIISEIKICASCGVKLYRDFHTETINGKIMNFCCVHCAKAYIELQLKE